MNTRSLPTPLYFAVSAGAEFERAPAVAGGGAGRHGG